VWQHIIWNEESGGNVEHIEVHGLTVDDVEHVLATYESEAVSRSSGLPGVFGYTPDGTYIIVVVERIDQDTIYPAGQLHQPICAPWVYHSDLSAATITLRPSLHSEENAMAHPAAVDQILTFFAVVHDPRRQHATTLHTLETILTITILATICGAQHWVEIAHWGHAKTTWLTEFLDLTHGIPSHDTFGRVFAVLDPASLQQAFASWMQALADLHQDIVALDGKTLRRSLDRADGKGPMHIVHAWSSANEMVLAQCKVDAKTNEITALPALLRMLNLAGAVVTLEAMGCQVAIARQIQDQGADDVLSVKEHQPSLYADCADWFAWLRSPHPLDQVVPFGYDAQVDGGHGRREIRRVWSTAVPEGLEACARWPGLASLVMGESVRQCGEKESGEQRYYISALVGGTDADAQRANRVIRTHWEIDNRVHWVLDVAMGEESHRTRQGESAQNLALIRKLALNLLRQEASVHSGIAAKQKRAGWDQEYLLKILSQT
jgi:predicted transposase YbfD/YdcC